MKLAALTVATILAIPQLAAAQPAPPLVVHDKAAGRVHSINIDPISGFLGVANLNYERLWNGTHGIIVEGWAGRPLYDVADSYRVGGAVGYRWHWRGRQNSGFLGVTLAHSEAKGTVEVDEMTYQFEGDATTLTGNIGKRWMLTKAVNITLRFGLGYGHYNIVTSTKREAVRDAVRVARSKAFNPYEDQNVGAEFELTVGYTF